MTMLKFLFALALLLFFNLDASAYGTVNSKALGQNNEHERITRRAYTPVFGQHTLWLLAGGDLEFGAVGAPDNPRFLLSLTHEAHCDAGDHFTLPGYPQSAKTARAHLKQCVDWMATHFDQTILIAGSFVDSDLVVDAAAVNQSGTLCISDSYSETSKKCVALTHFGIMLHAVQDFYSHSNWSDIADDKQKISPLNPPGLGMTTPAPFLKMPAERGTFPPFLMTGCFELMELASVGWSCNYTQTTMDGEKTMPRVKHHYLNKDKGGIDLPAGINGITITGGSTVGLGKTPRGKVNNNFARSVDVAVQDTSAKLTQFQSTLVTVYGKKRGAAIFCAFTHDDPVKDCNVKPKKETKKTLPKCKPYNSILGALEAVGDDIERKCEIAAGD